MGTGEKGTIKMYRGEDTPRLKAGCVFLKKRAGGESMTKASKIMTCVITTDTHFSSARDIRIWGCSLKPTGSQLTAEKGSFHESIFNQRRRGCPQL